jgi:AraC family transcriptional regulator, transcriptional activator of pobA
LETGLSFKISPFKEKIKKTKPRKHDEYYELIFLSEREGFNSIESEKYLISTPEFYFLQPGQLHYWQFTSISKGYVILFKISEFDELSERHAIEFYKQLFDKKRLKQKLKLWRY